MRDRVSEVRDRLLAMRDRLLAMRDRVSEVWDRLLAMRLHIITEAESDGFVLILAKDRVIVGFTALRIIVRALRVF